MTFNMTELALLAAALMGGAAYALLRMRGLRSTPSNWPDISDVTRLEVIDELGRDYTASDINVEFATVQDEGRTLKIFVSR